MKILFTIILIFFITSCAEIKKVEMDEAEKVCKNNQGIEKIVLKLDYIRVVCVNGAVFVHKYFKENAGVVQ